jgi:hypothetical protein
MITINSIAQTLYPPKTINNTGKNDWEKIIQM